MKKIFLTSLIVLLFLMSFLTTRNGVAAETPTPSLLNAFPTATAYQMPKSTTKTYTNEEYGFSISIPSGFTATDAPADANYFQDYTMGDNEGGGYLQPTGMSAGDSLQTVGKQMTDSQVGGFENLKILTDKEITSR